jgi:hypothetical protein
MAPHRSRATDPAASSMYARDSGAWSRWITTLSAATAFSPKS